MESKADLYEKGDQLPFQIINCSRMGQKDDFSAQKTLFQQTHHLLEFRPYTKSEYVANPQDPTHLDNLQLRYCSITVYSKTNWRAGRNLYEKY